MAPKKSIFPREGIFTADSLTILLKNTILNPTITLPIFLALQYTPAGKTLLSSFGADGAKIFRRFKVLLALGVVGRINWFFSHRSSNNWTTDTFSAPSEIVVVTGGSSGIGAATVQEFVQRGVEAVVVLDVQPLLYEAPKNVHFFKVDLSSPTDIASVCAQVRQEVGNPTVLINNAGICRGKSILDASVHDINLTFAVNTTSHYFLAKEFLPAMIAANHGHIVTIASIGAFFSGPLMVDYDASKSAALGFHEGLGLELKYTYKAPRVRTTLVTQGYVDTPLFKGFKNESKFLLPALAPETLAEAVVKQVFSASSGHIILPRAYTLLTSIRGMPIWYQNRTRSKTHDMMAKWNGKQVIE